MTSAPRGAMVAQPLLTDDGDALGVLVAVTVAPARARACSAPSARWPRYAASQLELADLDASRARLDRAEVLALRAQISPHFIYNALNTIASFVRTDPDRARELILEFADFTRYSFRAAGQYTTLSDELRNIDRYLTLERARFGEALTVRLQVAPEMLNVVVPFLALQPLVENAVRHGLADRGGGTVEIVARDDGTDCVITVEDDGVGMDPDALRVRARRRAGRRRRRTTAATPRTSGLTNVDHRLRAAFGNDYGLVVETAVGAGTKVIMRVPKFRSGVRAGGGAVEVNGASHQALTVLAVDDEAPALDELAYLLGEHPDIGRGASRPATRPRRCGNSTGAPSTRCSSTSTCPASAGSNWPACWPTSPTAPRWCS